MFLLAADAAAERASSSTRLTTDRPAPRCFADPSGDRRALRRDSVLDHYFFLDAFTEPDADATFLGKIPDAEATPQQAPPAGLPAYLSRLWTIPLLSGEQEQRLFRKLNYLKYRLVGLKSEIRSCRGCEEMLHTRDALTTRLLETRDLLIESNLRLVVSLAKRYSAPISDRFEELVGVGNAALIHAVDRFDFRRGFRFSTYGYKVVQRSLFDTYHRDQRFQSVSNNESPDACEPVVNDAASGDLAALVTSETWDRIIRLMDELDDRDKHIVMSRLGFKRANKGVTFRVIAEELGISTTRVAQLFHRSVEKMRASAIEAELIDGDEFH